MVTLPPRSQLAWRTELPATQVTENLPAPRRPRHRPRAPALRRSAAAAWRTQRRPQRQADRV